MSGLKFLMALVARHTLAGALLVVVTSCSSPLPPILQGASSASGWSDGCPQPAGDVKMPLALSPELDARLHERYPPGTPASKLVSDLHNWQFVDSKSCANDPTVQSAYYDEPKGPLTFYSMFANVYWKVDTGGRIVWTEGFVAFSGL